MNAFSPLSGLLACGRPNDHVVATAADGAWTQRRWLSRVARWAGWITSQPPRGMALHLEDTAEASAAIFAAWHVGIDLWLPGDTTPATRERLAAKDLLWLDRTPVDLPGAAPLRSNALSHRAGLTLFTSGSSGTPVAIHKSLAQLEAETRTLEACFGAHVHQAEVVATVSHQHIYGLLFRLLWPLAGGRTFAAERLQFPEQIAALSEVPRVLVSSPAHLKRLPRSLDWTSIRRSLQVVFSSGGPLSERISGHVQDCWGKVPCEIYGSTETGGIACRQGGTGGWMPLPDVQWRIDDDALAVRSPHLPGADWYVTQDRARALDGGFELLGRADRIVKLEERRISLDAIENRLRESALVEDARVLMIDGERIALAAVVVPTASGRQRLNLHGRRQFSVDLREWTNGHVEAPMLPRRWRFVSRLPADSRGKTTRTDLLALFRPTRPSATWIERDAAHARLDIEMDPELMWFEGHFPDVPILPGVAQIDWALHFACKAFSLPDTPITMEALKFQQVIQPAARVELDLQWNSETDTLRFHYRSGDNTHASGRLRFMAADSGSDR